MADQTNSPNSQLSPVPPIPQTPFPPVQVAPRPATPPIVSTPPSISVRDTDLSRLSPSPAPFSDSIQRPPTSISNSSSSSLPPQKSTIRTMASDLESVHGTRTAPPPTPLPPPPNLTPPPIPKQNTMDISKPTISVPPPPSSVRNTQPSNINIPPQSRGIGKKALFGGIFVILFLGALAWWIVLKTDDSVPAAIPTVSSSAVIVATTTPTPVPVLTFEQIYSPADTFSYLGDANTSKKNLDSFHLAETNQTFSVGSTRFFSAKISLSDFAKSIGFTIPSGVASSLDNKYYFTFFGKPDGTVGRGLAIKVVNVVSLKANMTSWESTISRDLSSFLNINTSKAASAKFLDNVYRSVPMRYRNFSDAFSTIDYSVITMPNGEDFLFITNTRDHMFVIIDKIPDTLRGK